MNLAGWQWLFALEGLAAIILGVVFFVWLPDSLSTARWLTPAERDALLDRMASSGPRQHRHTESIGPALRDRRVWLLGVFNFCMLGSSYAYGFSAPTLVQTMSGMSITGTGFLLAAMYLLAAIAMSYNGMLSDRGRDSYRYVIPGCLMMSAGFVATSLSSNSYVALSGLLVVIVGHMSMQGPLWSIATRFLSGRAAAAGIMLYLRWQSQRAAAPKGTPTMAPSSFPAQKIYPIIKDLWMRDFVCASLASWPSLCASLCVGHRFPAARLTLKQKPPEGGFLIWCIFPRESGNLLVSGKSAFPDLLHE